VFAKIMGGKAMSQQAAKSRKLKLARMKSAVAQKKARQVLGGPRRCICFQGSCGLKPPRTITAATATAAITASTAAATTAATCRLGTSFVDGDLPTTDTLVVQTFNCLLGFFGVWHFDEGEAA